MTFAEFEREMISERTRDKIAGARRRGKWTGGPTPFGYAAKDKKLVVNEGEAAIVREAYRVFLDHGRVAQSARDLTANGLLPRRASWGRPDKELRWTKDSLSRLLENPLYAGIITCGEDSVDGEHEAIIEREQWERTQRVLRERVRGVNCHGVNPDYVLRGLLRCGKCGEAMCPASTRKGKKVHRYYRCMTRDKFGKGCCGAAQLAAGAIETYVMERVGEWAGQHDLTQECHERLVPLRAQRKELLESQKHHLAERLGEANARCGKLADEWVNADGAVKGVLRQRVDATTTELEQLKQAAADVSRQLAEVAERQYDLEWVARALSNFRTLWVAMTSLNRGRLMRGLLEKIVVHESTGKVDIHFADFEAGLEATAATEAA